MLLSDLSIKRPVFAAVMMLILVVLGIFSYRRLAIGLLIDDAIVVRENIVRHLERGEDYFTAAKSGASEIGLAVMATTFTIVCVFIPVAYMKGIVGRSSPMRCALPPWR